MGKRLHPLRPVKRRVRTVAALPTQADRPLPPTPAEAPSGDNFAGEFAYPVPSFGTVSEAQARAGASLALRDRYVTDVYGDSYSVGVGGQSALAVLGDSMGEAVSISVGDESLLPTIQADAGYAMVIRDASRSIIYGIGADGTTVGTMTPSLSEPETSNIRITADTFMDGFDPGIASITARSETVTDSLGAVRNTLRDITERMDSIGAKADNASEAFRSLAEHLGTPLYVRLWRLLKADVSNLYRRITRR